MTEPQFRAMGEAALLVDFGGGIDEATHRRVIALDHAIALECGDGPLAAVAETVPAYTCLMVRFDVDRTDHGALAEAISALLSVTAHDAITPREHIVPVCYDPAFAPDIEAVANRSGLSPTEVARRHADASYRTYMYGFAPGYAYLGGVPKALQLPRKADVVRGHPVGSVMIAGPQCLITTLDMPTGWWVIGRTPMPVFTPDAKEPFRFVPGDTIRFEAIHADRFASWSEAV